MFRSLSTGNSSLLAQFNTSTTNWVERSHITSHCLRVGGIPYFARVVLKMAAKRDMDDSEGRPPPKVPKSWSERHNTKRLIIVLERSSLETVKVSLKI